jgi:hypothetical protein
MNVPSNLFGAGPISFRQLFTQMSDLIPTILTELLPLQGTIIPIVILN